MIGDGRQPGRREAIVFDGKTYSLDQYGFLDPPEQWDAKFAEGIARLQGIHGGLTDEHWKLVEYLREKFLVERTVPMLVHACADNGLRLGRLRHLFPMGYHRGACRIAGINYQFMVDDNVLHTYENLPSPQSRLKSDLLGFLERFDDWTEAFAEGIAARWGLVGGLTERHHRVIAYLRDYYRVHRAVPPVYLTCEANDLDLSDLRELFPAGYRRGACRAAGLPFFG